MEWTKEEARWLSRAQRLFRERPPNIRLYTTDGEISACKDGVPSDVLLETVAPGDAIMAGCMLPDMHD
jgi:hypothetical protein